MQTVNLDLSKKEITPLLYAKQADVGRKFKVILTDGGKAYPLSGGATVSVWYTGASGEGNYTDIGADSAVSVSGNEIIVEMIAQMLANYGVGTVCIVIHTADGEQLGTWNIPYMVEPLPGIGSTAAKDYFTAFSKAVETLPYPDASLSAPGKAADAAATGAALAGKAPAGYFEQAFEVTSEDDLNTKLSSVLATMSNNSVKLITVASKNGDFLNGLSLGCRLFRRNATYGCASMFSYGGATTNMIEKSLYGGVWQPASWVNPNMQIGVEYRTTERYAGKAVYTKLLNLGSVSGSSVTIEATHGIVGRIISATASVGYYIAPGIPRTGLGTGDAITVFTDSTKVYVNSFGYWGGGPGCYAWLKYIKD